MAKSGGFVLTELCGFIPVNERRRRHPNGRIKPCGCKNILCQLERKCSNVDILRWCNAG